MEGNRKSEKQKMALSERYTRGEISKAVYFEQKAVLDVKLTATGEDMVNLEGEIGKLESPSSFELDKAQQLAQTYLGEDSLIWEMAHAFIEAIMVTLMGAGKFSGNLRIYQGNRWCEKEKSAGFLSCGFSCIPKTTRWASGSKKPRAMREREKLLLL